MSRSRDQLCLLGRRLRFALESTFAPDTAYPGTTADMASAGHCAVVALALHHLYGAQPVSTIIHGPDGMLTYIWRDRVQSENPGYCYKVVGWARIGRSADGKKDLLSKPFALAGVP